MSEGLTIPDPSQLVEAVLFTSSRPLGLDALRSATALPTDEVSSALAGLAQRYSPSTSGIVLRNVAGGYMLSTNPACAPAVERFREEARPAPLSGASLEVLSCAFYHGPLTRAAISRVRGVNSDAVVRNLLDRGLLVEIGLDYESPGTPAFINVTEEFMVAVGAASPEDFPPLDTLAGEEELARLKDRLSSASGDSQPEGIA